MRSRALSALGQRRVHELAEVALRHHAEHAAVLLDGHVADAMRVHHALHLEHRGVRPDRVGEGRHRRSHRRHALVVGEVHGGSLPTRPVEARGAGSARGRCRPGRGRTRPTGPRSEPRGPSRARRARRSRRRGAAARRGRPRRLRRGRRGGTARAGSRRGPARRTGAATSTRAGRSTNGSAAPGAARNSACHSHAPFQPKPAPSTGPGAERPSVASPSTRRYQSAERARSEQLTFTWSRRSSRGAPGASRNSIAVPSGSRAQKKRTESPAAGSIGAVTGAERQGTPAATSFA